MAIKNRLRVEVFLPQAIDFSVHTLPPPEPCLQQRSTSPQGGGGSSAFVKRT